MWMPSEVKRASKALVNLVSRSRIRKRDELICSPRSISRLRASWVVQAAVGWAVTPRIWIRWVRTSLTNKDVESVQRDGVEGEQGRWPANLWPEPAGRFATRCLLGVVPVRDG